MRPWPRLQFVLPREQWGCGLFASISGRPAAVTASKAIYAGAESLFVLLLRSFDRFLQKSEKPVKPQTTAGLAGARTL